MKRWVYVSRNIDRSADVLWEAIRQEGRHLLQNGDDRGVRPDGSFCTHVTVPGARFIPTLHITLGVGSVRADGRRVIPLKWAAETTPAAFPRFEGSVELEPMDTHSSRISFVGSYVPPLGPVGGMVDAAVLHGHAERTAEALLGHLVDRLEQRIRSGMPMSFNPMIRLSPTRRMTVVDVMTKDPVVIDVDLPLKTAALLLFHLDVSGAPVVSADGDLVGVLTESDLLVKEGPTPTGFGHQAARLWTKREAATAGQACSRPARTTASDVSLRDAVGEMASHGIRRLVVVDNGVITGIITRHDALAAMVRSDEQLRQFSADLIDELGEEEVEVEVVWGVITLTGTATRRSRCQSLAEKIRRIDGVMEVDASGLKWAIDDVIPTVPMAPLF